jgi:lysophospholipase L1-like esterase
MMTARWTKLYIALFFVMGVLTARATAQGDPEKAFDPATAAIRKPGTTVRIDLIGDSTQTDHAGYGRGFCANLSTKVDCVNMAKGGASTRSFRAEGLWEKSLETKPDYMLIQFGHNDAVFPPRPNPNGGPPIPYAGVRALNNAADYEKNLRQYVTEARAAGIKPILVTPVTRQYFQDDGKIHSDQTVHSETMRAVAKDMNVPLIELQLDSIAFFEKLGKAEGAKLGITKKDATGATITDKTHFNWAGSYKIGRIVAVDMGKSVPKLQKYVRPEAAKLPPAGVKAMAVFNGGPVKIVLVGDSTVATGGGWGPGFCAVMTKNVECDDVALNGRSSKSYIDEGAWKKALALHGDYYLIQFGHNDQKTDPARFTDPATTFPANLHRMVADVRAIGAIPVLVTSLSRRNYKDGQLIEDLTPYVDATKKVGAEEYITVVDLNGLSVAMLKKMTQDEADKFDATAHPDAKAENKTPAQAGAAPSAPPSVPLDRTHLNPEGQKVFGRIVADQIVRTLPELGPDTIGVPMPAGARGFPMMAPPDTPPEMPAMPSK